MFPLSAVYCTERFVEFPLGSFAEVSVFAQFAFWWREPYAFHFACPWSAFPFRGWAVRGLCWLAFRDGFRRRSGFRRGYWVASGDCCCVRAGVLFRCSGADGLGPSSFPGGVRGVHRDDVVRLFIVCGCWLSAMVSGAVLGSADWVPRATAVAIAPLFCLGVLVSAVSVPVVVLVAAFISMAFISVPVRAFSAVHGSGFFDWARLLGGLHAVSRLRWLPNTYNCSYGLGYCQQNKIRLELKMNVQDCHDNVT